MCERPFAVFMPITYIRAHMPSAPCEIRIAAQQFYKVTTAFHSSFMGNGVVEIGEIEHL